MKLYQAHCRLCIHLRNSSIGRMHEAREVWLAASTYCEKRTKPEAGLDAEHWCGFFRHWRKGWEKTDPTCFNRGDPEHGLVGLRVRTPEAEAAEYEAYEKTVRDFLARKSSFKKGVTNG